MRAVVYDRYGASDVLHVAEVPDPELKPNEIRLAVKASEVTKGDCEIRSLQFAAPWLNIPMRLVLGIRKPRKRILGGYVSGVVTEVGQDVTRFQTGDEVFGCTGFRFGGYGETVCLPQTYTLSKKPEHLSHAEAATIPLGALNALHFMNLANIKTGDSVLIIGAGGSIGSFAIQIAKDRGATVTAIDAVHKQHFVQQLGADHFYDYRETQLSDFTHPFNVVFNMVSATRFEEALAIVSENGCYLTANPRLRDMRLCRKQNRKGGKRAYFTFAGETQQELDELAKLFTEKRLQPILDRSFAMTEASAAHDTVEQEKRLGAVALDHTLSI